MPNNKKFVIGATAAIFIIVLIGIVYIFFFVPEPPADDISVDEIKVNFTLPKTVFEKDEEIIFKPELINTGDRSIVIGHAKPLFFIVFQDERGLNLTYPIHRLDILRTHELVPNEPYSPDEHRITPELGAFWEPLEPRKPLEPGKYIIYVYAEFGLEKDEFRESHRIYASPFQIEVR
ncbi:MAG: hypothetical protein PQ975_11065 [Methanobacterium sp.]|jgi:hypothetical protein